MSAGYSGEGLRAWTENSSARTYFLYDGAHSIIEMNSTGSVVALNSIGANGLASRRDGSTSVFYNFDAEGNVAQESNTGGSIMSNLFFDSHGLLLSGTTSHPFRYKAQFGYYTDSETELQLLTHRYYDPSTGRFMTQDPIGYSGGINLNAYTKNRTIDSNDPSGLFSWDSWIFGVSFGGSANAGVGIAQAGGTAQQIFGVSVNPQGAAVGGPPV